MAYNCKKGQAGVEAMVYVGIFLFLTVFFSIFILDQQVRELRTQQFRLGSEIAAQIGSHLEIASLAGPGFNSTFWLPADILGRPYIANMTSSGLLYITVISPQNFMSQNVTFYYPVGRGNIDVDTTKQGFGVSSNYTAAGGRSFRAVWFNTTRGWFQVAVKDDGTIMIY